MRLRSIGAILAILVVVFILGRVWFAIVERVLGGFKRLFGKRETGVWHTLPSKQEKKENEDV